MVSVPFAGNGAPPGFRRPVLEVAFGGGSADDWREAIVSITVESCLAPSADVAELHLSTVVNSPTAAVGDAGSISLGYEDGASGLVFTGQVEAVGHGLRGVTRVIAANSGAVLSSLRVNQSYEDQKAGEIAEELAGRVGVATDVIEDGLEFPFYVVDDRSNAYQHIASLAARSGCLAYFTPEDKLIFAAFAATQPVQTFTYGQDILFLEVSEGVPAIGAVTTIGEGAAGSQGKEAWNWLVKDPSSIKGSAGAGDLPRDVSDSSLRSAASAQGAADGILNAASLTNITGRLVAPGAPAATAGSAVGVAGAPEDALNGLYLVRRVKHHYSKRAGFITIINFSKTGSNGLGGLGGLL